jgi:tetratricopeptide (TPR) repeat protein
VIERMAGIYRELNSPLGLATATLGLGLVRRHFDRPKALAYFREAQVIAARATLANEEASALNNIARSSGEMGLIEPALEASRRAYNLLRDWNNPN